jgi:hypothetical protein
MVYLGLGLRLLRSNSANSSLRRRKRRFTSNASSRSASALARCFLALLAWATALSKLIRLAIAVSLAITSFSGPEEYGLIVECAVESPGQHHALLSCHIPRLPAIARDRPKISN